MRFDGRVVDEDIQAAPFPAGGVDQVGALELVGNVGGDGDGCAPGRTNSGGGSFGPVGIDIVDGDFGAGGSQVAGNGRTQSLPSPGNNCHPAIQ